MFQRLRAAPCDQHVYGTAVGVHSRDPKVFQHQVGKLASDMMFRVMR
jgi:hypothetical protein